MDPSFFRLASRFGALALSLLMLAVAAPVARAVPQPITVKELCLMLRGGYTGDDVLRETAGRPLLGPIDADAEKSLTQAGADARFIAAFKAAHRPLSDDELAAVRQRDAEAAQRKLAAWEENQSRLLDVHKQAAETVAASHKQAMLGKLAQQLHGQLVRLRDTGMQPYDDNTLAGKKLFAFYFAEMTNPECRKFTPQLVKFYQDFAPKHPAFEVVFVSGDRSAFNMENYMRQDAMPWPALAFERKAQQADLVALGKQVMPRLTLIDGMGRIVSDSVVEGKYVGPQHVLDDLGKFADAAP